MTGISKTLSSFKW